MRVQRIMSGYLVGYVEDRGRGVIVGSAHGVGGVFEVFTASGLRIARGVDEVEAAARLARLPRMSRDDVAALVAENDDATIIGACW